MDGDIERVIALGFFDGVHTGHGVLINRAKERAEELHAVPAVLTFDRHPGALVSGKPLPLINSAAGRVDIIGRKFGISEVIIIHFDDEMREMLWEEFVRFLQSDFGAVHLVVGDDFRFGYRGQGTPERLLEKCGELNMGCDVIPEVTLDGIRVGSTYIRECIANGDIERANMFLGHPHTLEDTVRCGYKFGRTIGAPTINMVFPEGVLVPAFGVYAAKVFIKDTGYIAVTNVGVRPTVGGRDEVTVESYILNYSGNLYGRQVRVEFHKFLRSEMKFSGMGRLKEQIQRDAEATREYFEKRN